MTLGTSVSSRIKQQVINKIGACPSVAVVYGFDKLPIDEFPAVFVKTTGMSGEFWTSAENMRIYTYKCTVVWPLGQDLKSQTDDRLQVADENVHQVVDEIINAVDSDYELGDYALVLFVNAVDFVSQEYEYEGGKAYGAEITLEIHSQYLV
jgi:hypothetical protein